MGIIFTISIFLFCVFTTLPVSAETASIKGPINSVPPSKIQYVLIEPEVSYPFLHHFMCVYIWDGTKWVVGTAGETMDKKKELQQCIDEFGENTADPDYVLNAKEYVQFENDYANCLANNGAGNVVCEWVGLVTCPFTLGHGKPCYRERVIIEDLLNDILLTN